MVICDHAHECDKECNHRVMHDHTSICDWSGCTWQHPRQCVDAVKSKLIECAAYIKQHGLVNDMLTLLKEPRKRKPTTIPADQVSTPLPDAISPVGVKHKTSRKKEA